MPVGASLVLSGRVTEAPVLGGTFTGDVYAPDAPEATFTGTVSRRVVDSWDGKIVSCRVRVKLAGEWVPEEDLILPVRHRRLLDSPVRTVEFGLRGRRYAINQTEHTWTRTAVEVYVDHGRPGDVIVNAEPKFTGYVVTCKQDPGPIVTVTCNGRTSLFDRYEMCEEYAPLAGYTVGQIVRLSMENAGIPSEAIIVPDGPVYNGPLQWTGKKLFPTLLEFIEPQGWKIRELDDGAFEFWKPELKRAPLPPDDTWILDDLLEPPSSIPATAPPTRYVLSASATVVGNSLGQQLERTVTEVKAPYSVAYADEKQLTDGTVVPTGLVELDPVLLPVSRIVDEIIREGSKVLSQTTIDYGWVNPRAAKLRGVPGGGGTAPDPNYSYISAYKRQGKFIAWEFEQFLERGRRVTTNTFDDEENPLTSLIDTYRYMLVEKAVVQGNSYPGVSVIGVWIFDDDQSYSTQWEAYGRAERQLVTYKFDESTGAQNAERQESYAWRSRHAARRPVSSIYVMYDGTARMDVEAPFTLVEVQEKTSSLSKDKLVKGDAVAISGYSAPEKVDGAYDFGSFKSNATEEAFGLLRVETVANNVITEKQFEQVTYPPGGGRIAKVFLGALPITRYKQSAWTRLVQQPLELALDDETARIWFGFEREAFTQDYVQTLQEALTVIVNRQRRKMAHTHEVKRPATDRQPGQSIFLIDDDQGTRDLTMVSEVDSEWGGPGLVETYRLERPL